MFNEQKPKKTKVQRNRTFREILFGIKVKHRDKESAIGKEKTKEKTKDKRKEKKARKAGK